MTQTPASVLIHSYERLQNAERPIDKKTAQAELYGMCKVLAALHQHWTEDAYSYAAMRVWRSAQETRPPFHPTSTSPDFKLWLAQRTSLMTAVLADLAAGNDPYPGGIRRGTPQEETA